MTKIIPFKSPASRRTHAEWQRKVALDRLEFAMRKAYDVLGAEQARTYAQLVQSKVDLDYGVVRIL